MKIVIPIFVVLIIVSVVLADSSTESKPDDAGVMQTVATTRPAETTWPDIAAALGMQGRVADNVYVVTVPRKDLEADGVIVDGFEVPIAAGIESNFYFYRCDCGKMIVSGQFVVTDYESNDVIDELRKGKMHITSVAPMFHNDRPRIMIIRFRGEDVKGEALAKTLKSALDWTGDARMPAQPIK